MAIRLVYGAPRSGKTYWGVHHLATTFFDRHNDGTFTPKDPSLKIVSNIDELKLPHDDLNEWLRLAGGVNKLFSYDYQEKIHQKYSKIVYFIDEAQMLFPDSFKDHSVFNWLQYHGHWGQDIYFFTQDIKLLPRQISVLAEITLFALPRSASYLLGYDLHYNVVAGKEIVDKKMMLKKSWVFKLYKSQSSTESQKVVNPFIKYALGFGLLLFGGTAYALSHFSAPEPKNEAPPRTLSPSSEITRTHDSKSSVRLSGNLEQVQDDPESSEPVQIKLNYMAVGHKILIPFEGQIYTQFSFPYPVTTDPLGNMYAALPPELADSIQAERDLRRSAQADTDPPRNNRKIAQRQQSDE